MSNKNSHHDPWKGEGDGSDEAAVLALHSSLTPTQIATNRAIKEGKEVCLCAANRFQGKVWLGHRHLNSMDAMHNELSYTMSRKEMMAQETDRDSGFLTNFNRYVDRKEGLRLQLAAGIPSAAIQHGDGYRNGLLFSEDLY